MTKTVNTDENTLIEEYIGNPSDRVDLLIQIYSKLTDNVINAARDKYAHADPQTEEVAGKLRETDKVINAIKMIQENQKKIDKIFDAFCLEHIPNFGKLVSDNEEYYEVINQLVNKLLFELGNGLSTIDNHNNNQNLSSKIPLWIWPRRIPKTVEKDELPFQFINHVNRNDNNSIDISMMPFYITNRATDNMSEIANEEKNQEAQKRLITLYAIQRHRLNQPLSGSSRFKVLLFSAASVLTLGILNLFTKSPATYALELKCQEQNLPDPSRLLVLSHFGGSTGWVAHADHWKGSHDKYYKRTIASHPTNADNEYLSGREKEDNVNSFMEPRPSIILPNHLAPNKFPVKGNTSSSRMEHLLLCTRRHLHQIEDREKRVTSTKAHPQEQRQATTRFREKVKTKLSI